MSWKVTHRSSMTNQPASNDGGLFPHVGVNSWGYGYRKGKGYENINLWSTNTKGKVNANTNIGRSVQGVRSSAFNVKGTSANSKFIDFAFKKKIAYETALKNFNDASDNLVDANNDFLRKNAITQLDKVVSDIEVTLDANNLDSSGFELYIDGSLNTLTDPTKTDASQNLLDLRNTFDGIVDLSNSDVNINFFDPSTISTSSIFQRRTLVQDEFENVKNLYNQLISVPEISNLSYNTNLTTKINTLDSAVNVAVTDAIDTVAKENAYFLTEPLVAPALSEYEKSKLEIY